MIKKFIVTLVLMTCAIFCTRAQVAKPFWPYTGIGTMCFPNGIYFGQIYMGFAHGEGYYYFYDGSVFHGYFNTGIAHGPGEAICALGYVAGIWNSGVFVQATQISQQQISNVYRNIQNNYTNNTDIRANYRNNTSNNSDFAISNYKIEDVSDTSFGSQLMGKME